MASRSLRGNGPVVVGVSGSAASFGAVARAAELYGPDREFVLVRAGDATEDPDVVDSDLDVAEGLLRGPSRRQVVLGHAVSGLCETADRLDAAVVVIGARAGVPSWAQPTVRGVTRAAGVPVLVVPLTEGLRYGAAPCPTPRTETRDTVTPPR